MRPLQSDSLRTDVPMEALANIPLDIDSPSWPSPVSHHRIAVLKRIDPIRTSELAAFHGTATRGFRFDQAIAR